MDGRQAGVMFPTFVMGFLPPPVLRLISYFAEKVPRVWFIATPWDLTRDWARLFAWTWLHPICMRMCSAWRQDPSRYLTQKNTALLQHLSFWISLRYDVAFLLFFETHSPIHCNCVQFWTGCILLGHWEEGTAFFWVFSQLVWLFCPKLRSIPTPFPRRTFSKLYYLGQSYSLFAFFFFFNHFRFTHEV